MTQKLLPIAIAMLAVIVLLGVPVGFVAWLFSYGLTGGPIFFSNVSVIFGGIFAWLIAAAAAAVALESLTS